MISLIGNERSCCCVHFVMCARHEAKPAWRNTDTARGNHCMRKHWHCKRQTLHEETLTLHEATTARGNHCMRKHWHCKRQPLHEDWEQDEHTLDSELSSITLHAWGKSSVMLHWGWHRVWRKPSQREVARIETGRKENWGKRKKERLIEMREES